MREKQLHKVRSGSECRSESKYGGKPACGVDISDRGSEIKCRDSGIRRVQSKLATNCAVSIDPVCKGTGETVCHRGVSTGSTGSKKREKYSGKQHQPVELSR